VAVYTSLRDASQCSAVNTYRQGLVDYAKGTVTTMPTKPSPITNCSPTFGNTEIKALLTP
jgi:hypothetical protein